MVGAQAPAEPRRQFTLDDVRSTYKKRDAWWTVFLVDPMAARMLLPIANRTSITPNQVSLAAFAVGLGAALAFAQGDHSALVVGALLYHLSFVLDCIDGKIARLKGTGSVFGMWLDYSFDRYRVLACTAGLMYGQYRRDEDVTFIWLAGLVTFLDMLRYMDALQVYKLRSGMNRQLRAAGRAARRSASLGRVYSVPLGEDARYIGVSSARDVGYRAVPAAMTADPSMYAQRAGQRADLHSEFRSRFGWWARVRDGLKERRVRPHLFSGIEYQMFIFIIGPLLNAVLPLVIFSAVMLLVFELAVIYKLLLSTRDFEREMQRLTATNAGQPGAGAETAAAAAEDAADSDDVDQDVAPQEAGLVGDLTDREPAQQRAVPQA